MQIAYMKQKIFDKIDKIVYDIFCTKDLLNLKEDFIKRECNFDTGNVFSRGA